MPERSAPSDSGESVSESSESEQTRMVPAASRQQQQRAEESEEHEEEDEEGDSETDGDDETGGARFDAANLDGSPVAKGAATVEQPAAKRGRDVNGRVDEPHEKRRKGKKDKSRGQQSAKSASPVKPVKMTRLRTEKANAVVALKADIAKPQTEAIRKREPSPVPMSSTRHKTAKKGNEHEISPSKVKKATAHWSSNREETLTSLMLKDKSSGLPIPISRSDGYWGRLLKRLLPSNGDITEAQLFDKVQRMRNRYHFLSNKFTEEGDKVFKNAHEEQMFQMWEGIWGSRMSETAARGAASQPATEREDSDERSEETASPAGDAKDATVQVGGDEEVERDQEVDKDEDGEEDAENTRKTGGLNQVGAAAKGVVTPFVSKPRLEFTPRPPREKHREAEDVMGGEHGTGAASAGNDGGEREIDSLLFEQVKQLRAETLAFFQKMRGTSFHSAEDIPRLGSLPGGLGSLPGRLGSLPGGLGSLPGGLGSLSGGLGSSPGGLGSLPGGLGSLPGGLASFSFGQGFGNSVGTMEKLVSGGGNDGALRLQKKCRELEIKELALFSGRLEVLQEQCRMRQEELQVVLTVRKE